MSFLKKLTAEFKEMMSDGKDERKKEEAQPGSGHYDDPQHGQHSDSPHQQYGQPQQHGYGGPPPGPQLPPGWVQKWDQNSQRWYYVEQATGRSQWEPPALHLQHGYSRYTSPPPPPPPPPPQHGYGAPPMHGHDQGYSSQHHYEGHTEDKKEKSGKGGMVAAGAGGLAVGALAGAALAGEDSSDEEHAHAGATTGYGAPPVAGSGPTEYHYGAPPPGGPPGAPLEDKPELSSSQRSSLEQAREDYDAAAAEVAEEGSDASSSDVEELQEAREEYHEEVESAHEELEDE